jgi:hypothetical protein
MNEISFGNLHEMAYVKSILEHLTMGQIEDELMHITTVEA